MTRRVTIRTPKNHVNTEEQVGSSHQGGIVKPDWWEFRELPFDYNCWHKFSLRDFHLLYLSDQLPEASEKMTRSLASQTKCGQLITSEETINNKSAPFLIIHPLISWQWKGFKVDSPLHTVHIVQNPSLTCLVSFKRKTNNIFFFLSFIFHKQQLASVTIVTRAVSSKTQLPQHVSAGRPVNQPVCLKTHASESHTFPRLPRCITLSQLTTDMNHSCSRLDCATDLLL